MQHIRELPEIDKWVTKHTETREAVAVSLLNIMVVVVVQGFRDDDK